MAEDTRLAEACLLLNYSNQSYREQMLLNKQLQETGEASCVNTFEGNQLELGIEPSPSKLITPPPEHEEADQETSTFDFDKNCINEINLATDGSQESTTSYHRAAAGGSGYNSCIVERHDSSSEPIKNLLAAVNCALPEFKNRPTILQRPSSSKSAAHWTHRLLSDHDYCLKQSYSSCTVNEAGQFKGIQRRYRKGLPIERRINSKSEQRFSNSMPDLHKIVTKRRLKLVAVHLGAGTSSNETESLRLAKTICEEVMLQATKEDDQSILNNSRKKRKITNSNCVENHKICNCQNHSDSNDLADSAENAVVQLIRRMEDTHTLNCGYGSNLNIMGQVECDASLMCDRTQMWTGVGAISGCKNPILLAKSLYDYRLTPRALGLIQPNLLVGSGAKQWMREHCPHLSIMDSKLISSKSFATYQKLKSRYDAANRTIQSSKPSQLPQHIPSARHRNHAHIDIFCNEPNQHSSNTGTEHARSPTTLDHGFYCAFTRENLKRAKSPFAGTRHSLKDNCLAESSELTNGHNIEGVKFQQHSQHRLDTVGAIAVDCDNNFASAISSGGLLLKYKGRVGQAAVPGAGCWCENSIAVSTTGVGEYLTLNLFARKFYDKMLTLRMLFDLGHVERESDLSNLISYTMDECFEDLLQSPALAHVAPHERLAGMLSVSSLNSKSNSPKRIDENDLYLSFAHNTSAMCVGYMTCNDSQGHSIMSRGKLGELDGRPVVETIKFSLDLNKEYSNNIGCQFSDNEIITS